MAEFNPQLNIQDPNYIGASVGTDRAQQARIQQIPGIKVLDFGTTRADTTAGDTLRNIANIGAGALKLVDDTIRETATEQIRSGVEDIRDRFTEDISTAISDPSTQVIPTNTAQDVPVELRGLDRRVGQLSSARTAGKLTEAGYWLQLDNFARSMRERYPGYKDFIDSKIAAYTGSNPANQLWRAQLSALSSMAARASNNASSRAKYIERNSHYLDPGLRQALFSGDPSKRPSDDVMMLSISNNRGRREALQTKSLELTLLDKQRNLRDRDVEVYGEDLLREEANLLLKSLLQTEEGSAMLERINAGEVPTAEEAKELNATYAEMESILRLSLNAMADQGIYSEAVVGETGPELRSFGPSLRAKLGNNYSNVLERAMGDLTAIKDRLYEKNYGIFPFMKNWDEVSQDSRIREMQKQDPAFEVMQDLNKLGGQALVNMSLGPEGGLLGPIRQAIGAITTRRVVTQKDSNLRDTYRYYRDRGYREDINPEVFTVPIDNAINTIQNKDVKSKARLNSVDYLFSDASNDEISRLAVGSQRRIYNKVTTPEFIESMSGIRKDSPEAWNRYYKFVKDHFVPLYRDSMGAIQNNNTNADVVTIGFDNKDRLFKELEPTPAQTKRARELGQQVPFRRLSTVTGRTPESVYIQQHVDRLNEGISQLLPVLQTNNPNAINYELTRLFLQGGLTPLTTESSTDSKGKKQKQSSLIVDENGDLYMQIDGQTFRIDIANSKNLRINGVDSA